MPTKILAIGDPHFKVNNREDMAIFTQECYRVIKERQPDITVLMGDILDRHENIHVLPLMDANKFLIQLAKLTKTFALIGNHDRINNSTFLTDEHPFTALKYIPNLIIVDNVVKDSEWLFVPYVPPGRFHEALGNVRETLAGVTAVFAHQEFKGCKYKNIVSTTGDVWPENFPLVVSGHIHQYGQPQENIIYVGTPLQHSFGDEDDCSVSLFTFTDDAEGDGEVEEERIYLNIPKKRIVRIEHDQVKEFLSSPQTFNGSTKLVVNGPHDKLQALSKSGILNGKPENTKIHLVATPSDSADSTGAGAASAPEKNETGATSFKETLFRMVDSDPESKILQETLHTVLGITPKPVASVPRKKKIIFA